LVFDGGVIDDPTVLRLPADELSDWEFVEPDRLGDYLPALQTLRYYERRGLLDEPRRTLVGIVCIRRTWCSCCG
jgi:hypothetical protein